MNFYLLVFEEQQDNNNFSLKFLELKMNADQ